MSGAVYDSATNDFMQKYMSKYFPVYYSAVEKCWDKQQLPSVFHQHCVSLFSNKQLSLCQFRVGLLSAHFMHSIYLLSICSRVQGEQVHVCAHAWTTWARSVVSVYERIMTGAGGGAACHLHQQLIRKENKTGLFLSEQTKGCFRPVVAQQLFHFTL